MMKCALIAAALSLLVTPALADNKVSTCTSLAETAKLAMKLRQTGADLAPVIDKASKELNEATRAFTIAILQIAYDEPLYYSDEAKERAMNEFSSKMFLVCMEEEA